MTAAAPEASPGSASGLESLPPVYFALVMATGIVSVACHLAGLATLADSLLVANVLAYLVLWALYLVRLWRFPRAVLADLRDHARAPGYFTIIAGTCVLGAQLVVVRTVPGAAVALWFLALVLYVTLVYGIFAALITRSPKPSIERGLNGGWLVAVVATQGVAVLGGQVHPFLPDFERIVLFTALAFWLFGGMLYVWIMAMIFQRYFFTPLDPAEMGAPYWIDAGAVAISTLAGDVLLSNVPHDPLLVLLHPFLAGSTLLFWATATWWIPMLILFGVWRHGIRRFPLRYEPGYWGMVFPLGMYTACSFELGDILELPWLHSIASVFVWIALFAWTATFAGLVSNLARRG